jgi:hypothetical protein
MTPVDRHLPKLPTQ